MRMKLSLLFVLNVFADVWAADDVWQKGSSPKTFDSKLKLSKTELSTKSLPKETPKPLDAYDMDLESSEGITFPPDAKNYSQNEDTHVYYNSTFYTEPEKADQFWVELNDNSKTIAHEMLSDSHRQATTVDLSFPFPFYGSTLKNVTIATGGFLYTGDYLHNWIAATQYIAPLMANFDTSLSPEATIKYMDNGTALTVQWDKVCLQDKPNDGAFTFQATLLNNGDIIFAYKDVPYLVEKISGKEHPVKIGVSDAYIIEREVFFFRRKTIYEYHRIDMMKKEISNHTAIYFLALPTCGQQKDCASCLSMDAKLGCKWCDAVQRCSDGIDRQRQNWVANGCSTQNEASCSGTLQAASTELFSSPKQATEISTHPSSWSNSTSNYTSYNMDVKATDSETYVAEIRQVISSGGVSTGAVVTIAVFLICLLGAVAWVFYAYKYPHSPSGQFLIKYRPSQWVSKRSDESGIIPTRHS